MRKRLSELNSVDWRNVRTAHGTAEHVPDALRALAQAQNAEDLYAAYWRLDNFIVLQGTLYESAYFAAPYIVDILLASQWTPLRIAAYDLAIEIARGVPDPLHVWVPPAGAPANLRDACRAIIVSGLDDYEADLRSPDPEVRRRALDLLTSFNGGLKTRLQRVLAGIDAGEDEGFAKLLERTKREL